MYQVRTADNRSVWVHKEKFNQKLEGYSLKKFALLLLTGLLTALMICFVAVSSAEDEITFRNIPWGISLEDAEEMIRQDKIDSDARFDKDYHSSMPGISYSISTLHNLIPWFREPKIQTTAMDNTNLVIDKSKLKVAGYDLERHGLVMYFAYLPETKDNNDSWHKDTALFAASYEIKVPGDDYKSTIADLKDKLAGVYGRKFITDKKKVDGHNCTFYIWQGANDTYVVLCDLTGIGIFSSEEVLIVYASKAWEDKVIEARIAYDAEKEALKTPTPFGNGNSDGL